jgi:hypothetical protein
MRASQIRDVVAFENLAAVVAKVVVGYTQGFSASICRFFLRAGYNALR